MPRKLPWTTHEGLARVSSPKRAATTATPPPKRAKVTDLVHYDDIEGTPISPNTQRAEGYGESVPPTSSPREHLEEEFMHEGIDNDDKYRMVEDEFLAAAQRFTVHLHAAEYKRQKKMVRAVNAEAIDSISRPVTGSMSDHTRRKVEAIARSKAQHNSIQNHLSNETATTEEPDDSSDGEGFAYYETTLRGLMDSPRRKAANLSKIPFGVATRAAAGFQKPTAQLRRDPNQAPASPQPKGSLRFGQSSKSNQDSSTDSSDKDDDLDAPMPVPRVASLPAPTNLSRSASVQQVSQPLRIADIPTPQPPNLSGSRGNSSSESSTALRESVPASSDTATSRTRRRLAHARLEQVKKEKDDEERRKLDLIPTFL